MTTNKDILSLFEKGEKENTKRLITNITPIGTLYPVLQGRQIIKEATTQNKYLKFYDQGIESILTTTEQIVKIANKIAMFNYRTRDKSYISDLHAGLYTMLTRGEKFLDIKPTYTEDADGKHLKSVLIHTTKETIYKAAFGVLVDRKGNAIRGASEIIKKAEAVLMPIIDGEVPMPRATATVRAKQENGEVKEAWISGEPIHVFRNTANLRNTIVIELDAEFSPLMVDTEVGKFSKPTPDCQFIHSIAGLTAFLQYGKYLTEEKYRGITAITAKKIILAIQTACEIHRISGLGVFETNNGRKNVTIRRRAIKNIIPEAMQNLGKADERINWKKASDAVTRASLYLTNAISKTDIWDDIETSGNIYIPATKKGAQFPTEYPKIAFLKFDKYE